MNNYEQELLSLYRENNSLREQLSESDISSIEKIAAIKDAIDELHQIIANLRPSTEVANALDNVVFALEETIK